MVIDVQLCVCMCVGVWVCGCVGVCVCVCVVQGRIKHFRIEVDKLFCRCQGEKGMFQQLL